MSALAGLLALTFALAVPAFPQSDSQKSSPPQRTAASTGALAVEADVGGILFIDGQRRSAIVASKVTVFNLTPGQHIVELRDTKDNILWKDTVTVPKRSRWCGRFTVARWAAKVSLHRLRENIRSSLRSMYQQAILFRMTPVRQWTATARWRNSLRKS